MKRLITGLCASFATLILLAAAPDPQPPAEPIQLCPGCAGITFGVPPMCPLTVGVTLDRDINIRGWCGCVGAECLQAVACFVLMQSTVTDAAGAHVFTVSNTVCGGSDRAFPSGQGCAPGFMLVSCTQCVESCL